MKKPDVSRRTFSLLAGTLATVQMPVRGVNALTAQEVVHRVQNSLGGEWLESGTDGFKIGDPATPVKAIATTAMATVEVLKQAVKAGANLIFTYEPTFFGRQENPSASPTFDDPVYKAKKEFIQQNGLVIFRLHDHWQARKEKEMTTGLAESLGWSKYRVSQDDAIYGIPATTAEDAVALIRKKLNLRGGLRAVGDRKARVRRVLLHPGAMPPSVMWQRYSEADLIIAGEVREWENTHFAADLYTAGEKCGLVTIGRVVSEDPGMRACAEWLKQIVTEVPTQWIATGDLYWRAL